MWLFNEAISLKRCIFQNAELYTQQWTFQQLSSLPLECTLLPLAGWLSDKRNVWTCKLISDLKIFQSCRVDVWEREISGMFRSRCGDFWMWNELCWWSIRNMFFGRSNTNKPRVILKNVQQVSNFVSLNWS